MVVLFILILQLLQALVQYLKSQGVQLCDSPTFPTPEILSCQDPEVATEDSPEWIIYWYV